MTPDRSASEAIHQSLQRPELAQTGSSSFPKAGVQLDDGMTAESVADLGSEQRAVSSGMRI
jgi:hypothetical protein